MLLCVATLWLLTRAAHSTARAPSPAPALAAVPPDLTTRTREGAPASHAALGLQARARHATTETHAAPAELEHAHPISEHHERLREQQALIGALNDALDLGDAAALRTLLTHYDALQAEDPMRLAEGYERVADCIESDEARADTSREAQGEDEAARASVRANAQRYYDDARASSVRRYVRRFCLEASGR